MNDKKKLTAITVRVNDELHLAIRKQCFVENVSKNGIANKALKEYIENHKNDKVCQ